MKIDQTTILNWTAQAETFLSAHGFTLTDVKTGVDAWIVASRANICREAYEDASVTDAHIQTALQRIFPNAVFKDKRVY